MKSKKVGILSVIVSCIVWYGYAIERAVHIECPSLEMIYRFLVNDACAQMWYNMRR